MKADGMDLIEIQGMNRHCNPDSDFKISASGARTGALERFEIPHITID
jgi:hypothetical protein